MPSGDRFGGWIVSTAGRVARIGRGGWQGWGLGWEPRTKQGNTTAQIHLGVMLSGR